MSTTEILNQVLDPFTDCLTAEAAKKIVEFHVDAATQARIDDLADKANAGELTEEERATYHDYVETFDLVAILKSKARTVLLENGA